jgi:hypothetical protein
MSNKWRGHRHAALLLLWKVLRTCSGSVHSPVPCLLITLHAAGCVQTARARHQRVAASALVITRGGVVGRAACSYAIRAQHLIASTQAIKRQHTTEFISRAY